MKLTRLAAALGAVALVGAGVIAVAGPASAGGGSSYPSPSPSSTCTPTDDQVIHHDAVTHVVHHVAVTRVVHHDAVTHVVHHDAVAATWWNWSPNKDQGPFDGPPAFPTDPRGTWQGPHSDGGPAQDATGTFLNGNGNGDWFHRTAGTAAWDETVVDRAAYDETVVDRAAYDETVVDRAAYDETIPGTACPPPYKDTITVTPFLDFTPPTCDERGSLDGAGPESGVLWSAVGGSPEPTTFTASPAPGYTFPAGAQTRWTVPDLHATGHQSADPSADCYVPPSFPVPVQLNAEPTPPTCSAAGAFSAVALGGELISSGEGVSSYRFAHVVLEVDRSVAGQVTLTVLADTGTTLDGLSDAWVVDDEGTTAQRTVTLGAVIPTQSTNAQAPCFHAATPTPTTQVAATTPTPTPSVTTVSLGSPGRRRPRDGDDRQQRRAAHGGPCPPAPPARHGRREARTSQVIVDRAGTGLLRSPLGPVRTRWACGSSSSPRGMSTPPTDLAKVIPLVHQISTAGTRTAHTHPGVRRLGIAAWPVGAPGRTPRRRAAP